MPISITSRFKPLTYDEITRPLIEQTQAQEALENAYIEASDQAAQIMSQANQQTDPIAYARLKNYSDALQQQADSLMRQGLNRNSRQALVNMRRRYNQDVVPVQAAVNRRNELMEERRKLSLTNPDMLWERDVIGLDELLQNPQLDYGRTIKGSEISKRAAALTAAIGRGRQSVSLGHNIDKYTQTVLSQSGLTPDEIQAALNGDDSVLDRALSNLYSSTGVDSWSNQAAKNAVRGYIQEGAMNGVGQFNIATQRDAAAARRDQLADRAEERKFQAALYGMHQDADGNWVYDPQNPGPKSRTPKLNQNGTIEGATDANVVAGPKSSKYGGTIYRTPEGIYCIKTGKDSYIPIGNQEDAATEYGAAVDRKQAGRSMLLTRPIMFKGDGATAGKAGQFNSDGAVLVSWDKLTPQQKGYINKQLAMYGLDRNDVVVYMDKDWGRNDYIVMPKGYDSYGNAEEETLEF